STMIITYYSRFSHTFFRFFEIFFTRLPQQASSVVFDKFKFKITDSDKVSVFRSLPAQFLIHTHLAQDSSEAKLRFITAEVRTLDEPLDPRAVNHKIFILTAHRETHIVLRLILVHL